MATRYPRINRKPIDLISRANFAGIKRAVSSQLEFDNQQNDLGLSAKDLELLSWNLATVLLCHLYLGSAVISDPAELTPDPK